MRRSIHRSTTANALAGSVRRSRTGPSAWTRRFTPSRDVWHHFTFGGVGITEKCEVKDTSGNVISGLFAAGEITGGSFFNNYPGGSGLMKGAVFGRLAGTHAADFAKANRA